MKKFFEIIYVMLAIAIIANGSAGTIFSFNGNNSTDSDQYSSGLGEKIIICTGWGYEYIDIDEYLSGKYQGKNEQKHFDSKHCPMCNVNISTASITPENNRYLELILDDSDKFKVYSISELIENQTPPEKKFSQAPPLFS